MLQDIDGFDENSIWITKDGREIKLRDLDDSHLNNLVWFLNRRKNFFYQIDDTSIDDLKTVLKKIASTRGFSPSLVGTVQTPYEKDGFFVVWDDDSLSYKNVAPPTNETFDQLRPGKSNGGCECGAWKVKSAWHSKWCPRFIGG